MSLSLGWPYGVCLIVMFAVAVLVAFRTRLLPARELAIAGLRAALQLTIVSLVLLAALKSIPGTFAFILLMIAVATWTSMGRVAPKRSARALLLAVPIATGPVLAIMLALATGLVPFRPLAILPIAGILIGNAMTSTSVTGKLMGEMRSDAHGQVEAGLSLGMRRRDAIGLVTETAPHTALLPNIDQTRTVGLVTLPGAFIGVLLAGASPIEAGIAQLYVLLGIMFAQIIASFMTREAIAAGIVPDRGPTLPPA